MERRRRPARLDAAAEPMTKTVRRREKPRERWLLTRKTWKYMSDAGRRLIPDGAQNRLEDVPRIEAYFQDVCAKEPRFLLWRKSSYPGAIPRPRRKKRPRGGSVRARSPSDDVPTPAVRPTDLFIPHTSGGRFDIAKLRRDFFAAPPPASSSGAVGRPTREPVGRAASREPAEPTPDEIEESNLVDLIRKYLKIEENKGISKVSESEELVRALRKYLKRLADRFPSDSQAGPSSSLLSYLSRYYRGTDNEHRVQDLLTDTDLLKKLCQDLRKTKPYRGSRSGGGGSGYSPLGYGSSGTGRGLLRTRAGPGRTLDGEDAYRSPPMSPPPLIEVFSESLEDKFVECGTQTVPIPEDVLVEIERAYRERMEAATAPTSPTSPPAERKPGRRRSSIDHEDVSQSVSDTIKRYFKMARKKSVDADKADKFKRINYDKNLRNIKPKNRGDFDDDGLSKGCNTVEDWIMTYRDFNFSGVESPPASPSQSHSFLSTLLGRGTVGSSAGGMQKSRSSSSVVSSVSKRLWRTRSRSSSRVASSWVPQGSCCWADGSGRFVRLTDTSLLTLSEVERRALQQAALARLQQINLGTTIKIPEENASAVAPKPKRRAYLLKQKALTTGFFDQRAKDEKDKDGRVGSVFGVPLAQCVETERALRRQQHGGSRASLASLGATEKGDDSDTSGEWCWAGLEEAGGGGPRVPALVSACLAHLRQHGLHTLGLFRVSASKKRVRQLREEWERSQEAALDAAVCPHDVGTLLKEFLRDLPDPLLCRDLYSAFLYTQKIRHRGYQWQAVRLIVQLLPAAHRDTLHALLSFLSQLASHAEDQRHHPPGNKMDAANLATVFAPNILHRDKPNEKASVEQLSERSDVINVVRQLVERQAELWTLPAEMLHEAYITLAHDHPDHLHSLLTRRAEMSSTSTPVSSTPDAASGETRRIWSREQFLHQAAATGGNLSNSSSSRRSESHVRRRGRDAASDTSSGSVSSALTILTRVRSSMEECGSSGVVCSPPHDSNDSASDCTEPLGCSDDDNVVITASLHLGSLPAPARAPAAPPRRRSTSQQDKPDSNRDSAVGSSSPASASNASSPPASPPPAPATPTSHPAPPAAPQRVTVTAGEVYSGTDIDRLLGLAKERNTSDARAVILRQQDDSTVTKKVQSRTEVTTRREDKKEVKREEKKEERREEKKTEKKDGPMLYKRGQIISSTRLHTP